MEKVDKFINHKAAVFFFTESLFFRGRIAVHMVAAPMGMQ